MSVALRTMKVKLLSQSKGTKHRLDMQLRSLEHAVKTARESLAKGEHLDVNMIVNASGLTGLIAEHNLLTDIMPYANEEG